MNRNIKTIASVLLGMPLLLTACHNDGEPRPVKLIEPNISKQYPEVYDSYLKSLRAYKESDHSKVFVWFDNSQKIPSSQAHHINALPDSVDAIALMSPDKLTDLELKEMQEVREVKGTKVIYSVDFDQIQADYTALEEKKTADLKPFDTYLIDTLSTALSLSSAYNYDGICVEYTGKSTLYLNSSEKKSYEETQRIFMALILSWAEQNPSKLLVFRGLPQNIVDTKTRDKFSLLFVRGEQASNKDAFTYLVALAKTDQTTGRLGLTVEYTRLNDPNKLFGYFGDGTLKAEGLAQWLRTNQYKENLKAVGLYNASTDYYNVSDNYHYTRQLIQVLNPSLK